MQEVKGATISKETNKGRDSFGATKMPPVTTVATQIADAARALYRDETSSVDLNALRAPFIRARDFAFGEKIAHGMVVTFGMGTAQIHISDTEIKPILHSLREYGHKLSECVEKYQQLVGMTPSKAGFRVFSLVLKKGIADGRINRELKTICDEALDINLRSPQDPQWKRQVVVPINGVETRITLSLAPMSLFSQTILRTLHTDVPSRDRHNRYGYQLTIEPEVATESVVLRTLKARVRQAVAVTALTSPMILTTLAFSPIRSADLLPQFNAHPLLQDVLGEATKFLGTVAAGVVSFAAERFFARRRLMPDS